MFAVQPSIASNGTLSYTPADDANGFVTVSVVLSDDGGTANGGDDTFATQEFTIMINSVNDEPSFTKGADQTINEDAGVQNVTGWATSIDAGASNESSQTLSFAVTNDNNSLFAVQPSIASNGTLSYTPADDANGFVTVSVVLSDDGGTANGGDDTFATQEFTIMINSVNDEPSFTKGADQTINEDAGVQNVTGWATSIDAGASNESSQTLSFAVTNDNNSLFAVQPSITSNGTLSYTPADDVSGTATVSVVLSDDGGTANGGDDTFVTQEFTITVRQANDTEVVITSISEDTGVDMTDFVTSDTTLTVTGTAEPNSVITFSIDGVIIPLEDLVLADESGNFSYTLTNEIPDGEVQLIVISTFNEMSLSSEAKNITIDTVKPDVVITSDSEAVTTDNPISVTIEFTEDVFNFNASNVSVSNGTITNFTGSEDIYTFDVVPTAVGNVTIAMNENEVTDLAGNFNTAAVTLSINYTETLSTKLLDTEVVLLENPIKEEIVLSSDIQIQEIHVYNTTGTLVATTKEVSFLPSGVYVVLLKTKNGVITKKVVKE